MQNNKPVDEEKSEPKENARMVENNEREKDLDGDVPPSRWDDIGKRAKHFASNRYNVIIVLLCVLLLIFFMIIVGLAARLGSIRCPVPNKCRTSECLRAASSVVGRAKLAMDPCTDFWSFSCGGWLERNPLPANKGSYSVLDQLRKTIYGRIRHLIDLVPQDKNLNFPQHKVKNFYLSCINLADIEYWVPEKLKHAIQEIGGWSILNLQQSSTWKRNDVLKKLHVVYGVPVFFRITVEADDRNPARNIIKLIPDGLGLPSPVYYFKPLSDTYVKAYKEFIKNLMQEMGVTLNKASRFAEDIFHYEKRLADIMPDAGILRNTSLSYRIMKIRELDKLSTSIHWSELLQIYFSNIHPEQEIAVLSEEYFSQLSLLISSTDERILNDYYMWRFVHTYVEHLSPKHLHVANRLLQTFEGVEDINLPHEERWEFCIRLTSRYMGYAVGSMYANQYIPALHSDMVQMYIHKVIGILPAVIRKSHWLSDQTSRDYALEKVLSLMVEPQNPNPSRNCSLENYYNELNVQSEYFQNIKNGIYFIHKKQEQMLREGYLQECSWPVSPLDAVASYKYAGNQLTIPAGLLDLPLFDFESPLAMKYGVLAAHMANKLSQMFDDKGIHYEAHGALDASFSNASLKAYHKKMKCLNASITNHTADLPFDPYLMLGSYISDVGGVKIAFEAFQNHAKESENVGELPGMELSNEQLFFVSYAQSLCEAVRLEKLHAYRDTMDTLPSGMRVMAVLQQIPEFSNAFSCSHGSEMNSKRYCQMW